MFKTESILDVMMMVFVTMIFMICFTPCYLNLISNDFGGFENDKEKSAKKVSAEIVPQEMTYTYSDVLLSLGVLDEYTPAPKKITINKGEQRFGIEINDNFFEKREEIIFQVSQLLKDNKNSSFDIEAKARDEGITSWDINIIN